MSLFNLYYVYVLDGFSIIQLPFLTYAVLKISYQLKISQGGKSLHNAACKILKYCLFSAKLPGDYVVLKITYAVLKCTFKPLQCI